MERLTYDFAANGQHCWQVKGADNALCKEVCRDQGDSGCKDCPIAKAFDRLAAYEDTGLEPEEIDGIKSLAVLGLMRDVKRASAIMDAEREGRLLVLPCKVGDAVYLPTKNDWGDLLSFEVIEIGVDRDGPFFVIDDEEHDHIPMSDIGADVFLSREKAEEALAKEAT